MTKPDVIVVGGGSAGCVLAARLSEDEARSVLLIEAGPDYAHAADFPPEIRDGRAPTYSHDWGYYTEPGAIGRAIRVPRAKVVGGCSATNAAFALRGVPADYDHWAALGNAGWSFDEVAPYFRRLEHDRDFSNAHHGSDGPLPIRRASPDELAPLHRAFLDAAWSDGFQHTRDFNDGRMLGAGAAPLNVLDGVRINSAMAYLTPARDRPNLTVRGDAIVDRVTLSGRRATGVRLASGETIDAGEVILAAGSYASPAILMRSGIGSPTELDRYGISVSHELTGVGENLIDHPLVSLRFAARAGDAQTPLFQTCAFASSGSNGPDLFFGPRSATPASDSPTGWLGSIIIGLMQPKSRGRLRLRSADPAQAPSIDLGFLTDPADAPRLVNGLAIARRLIGSHALSRHVAEELFPGPSCTTESELAAAVRGSVSTFHHPVGTCRMGTASDPMAVVDAKGRVHGVAGLRVIDASIMATVPSANTNVPTIMIAEKLSAA